MEQYKSNLDTQVQLKKKAYLYGNMTAAEKKLNNDEILAYKNHDNTNYAMIHGISSSPVKNSLKMEEIKQNKEPAKRDFDTEMD